jgi:hypothetical protein
VVRRVRCPWCSLLAASRRAVAGRSGRRYGGRLRRALHNRERAESLPGADQLVPAGPAAGEVEAGAAGVSG